jgi:HEAT repeat protein/KaiC/GvpD/RAD55 family RecA-like ATPase
MPKSAQRNVSQILDAYHTHLLSKVSKVRILGEPGERELKDVFVELSIADQRAPQQRAEFLSMWDAGLRKRFKPFAAPDGKESPERLEQRGGDAKRRLKPDQLLRNGTKAIVTGAPGCGKTTLFKYLALQAKKRGGRLVVWLELKAIDKSLFDEAERAAARDGSLLLQELWLRHLKLQLSLSDTELNLLRRHWRERLAASEITVLLDGFDELQDEATERSLNRCVREFAAALHDNTLLISTRPYAQHKLGSEHLRELEIEPLDQRQIEAFLNCYYPNDGATKSLLKILCGRSPLRELLHVPLLLGVVLRLHRENKLTDWRLELYETIIADLVHGLDRTKSVVRRFKINDERLRLDFLKFLAFDRLLRDPLEEEEQEVSRVVFSYDSLKEKAKAFLAQERSSHHPRDLAEDALATMLLREIRPGIFAFTHLTLQEFLAAQAFAAFYKADESGGLKIFCRAYHNTSLVELEVLPMILGSLTGSDKLYAEIERWPDSLTFVNLRLRARGLIYGANIKQQRLAALCEKFADTVMWRSVDEYPYRGMILSSFANARGAAGDCLIGFLSDLLTNPDPYARMSVVGALSVMGSERAVDLLLMCLEDDNPSVQVDAVVRLGETRSERAVEPLVEVLSGGSVLLRAHAARALGRIGSEKAIEPLRLALKDSERMVRGDAIEALENIGTEAAAKALTVALREEEGFYRQKAVLAIGKIGSENFIDNLISCLKDSDSDLRSYIAQALKLIGSAKATLALQRVIRSDDHQLRRYAVEVLKLIASNGAIELLLTASQDEDSSVRKTVAEALHSVFFFSEMTGHDDENDSPTVTTATRKLAVKCLIGALQDEDVEVRAAAASSLTNYHDQSATPQLQEALHDESENVRANAARALGFYGFADSISPLIKALNDESCAVRAEAADALGRLGSPEAIDPLLRALHDKDQSVRKRAVIALGNIGAKSAVEQVLEVLQDEDYKMRACAAIALGQIGEECAFEPLLERLTDGEAMVREYAVESLGRIGGERSLDALSLALDDDGGHVRISATEELAKISSEKSTGLLEVALRDLDLNVTKRAAQALGNIGSARAMEILVAALRNENHHTRADAAEVLAHIETQPVIEAIFQLVCDPGTDLRPYASWYLAKCDEFKLRNAIINSLINKNPLVRRRSAQVVGYYSDNPDILKDLSQLAEDDPEISVRNVSKEALGKFARKLELFNFSVEGKVKSACAEDLKYEAFSVEDSRREIIRFKNFVERQAYRDIFIKGKPQENIARTLLQTYLIPRSYREVPVRGGQTDLLLMAKNGRFLYETKIWRGPEYYEQGLREIEEYVIGEDDEQGLVGIFYVIFDPTKSRSAWRYLGDHITTAKVCERQIHVIVIDLVPPQPSKKSRPAMAME